MPKSKSKGKPNRSMIMAAIISVAAVATIFVLGIHFGWLATVHTGPQMVYWSPADGSTFQTSSYGGNPLAVTIPLTVQVNIPYGSYVDSIRYTAYADGVAFLTDKGMTWANNGTASATFTDSLVLGSHSNAHTIKIVYTLFAESASEIFETSTHTVTLTSNASNNPTPTTGEVRATATYQGATITATLISTSSIFNRATTPFDICNVQPGTYVLNATFQKLVTDSSGSINHYFSSQKTITVSANTITTVVFDTWTDVTPTQSTYYGVLTIITNVNGTATNGIAITVNGVADTTPYSKQLPVGSYAITATLGFDTETATANVLAGQTVTSTLSLAAAPGGGGGGGGNGNGTGGNSGNQGSNDTYVTVTAQGNAIFQLVDDKDFSGSITLPNGTSYAINGKAPTADIGQYSGNVTISIGSTLFAGSGVVAVSTGSNAVTFVEGFSLLVFAAIIGVSIFVILIIALILAVARRRGGK